MSHFALLRRYSVVLAFVLAGCTSEPMPSALVPPTPDRATIGTVISTSAPPYAATPPAPTREVATTETLPSAPTTLPATAATTAATITASSPTPALPTQLIDDATLTHLRPLREVGLGRAIQVAIAPDGSLLAVTTSAGVALVELPSLRVLRFDAIIHGGYEVAFSRDSTLLAVSFNTNTATSTQLRRVADGAVLATVDGSKPLFSRDGQTLATNIRGDNGAVAVLWHTNDGTKIGSLSGELATFSPDGQFVAMVQVDGASQRPFTQIWRIFDGKRVARVDGADPVFSPNGLMLATTTEKDAQLWDIATSKLLHAFALGVDSNTPPIAVFSADGKQVLIAAGYDIQAWNVADGSHSSTAKNAALWDQPLDFDGPRVFDPAGTTLAVFAPPIEGQISGMRLVRTNDGKELFKEESASVVAFTPDGTLAATVSLLGQMQVIHTSDGSARTLDLPGFSAIVFSPEGATLLAAGPKVYLWDVITGEPKRTLTADQQYALYGATRLQFSPDRQQLSLETAYGAEGTLENSAYVWNLAAGNEGKQVWDQLGYATSDFVTAFSPVGNTAVWSQDSTAFNLQRSGGISLTLTMPLTVTAARFNAAGTLLAIGDAGGNVSLRDPATPTADSVLHVEGAVHEVEWSSDGTLLGALRNDGLLLVWHIGEQEPFARLQVDPESTRFIFSADNRTLIAAGQSGVSFFRLSDGQRLHTLPIAASDIALGPGRRLLAVLSDERVTLWGVGA